MRRNVSVCIAFLLATTSLGAGAAIRVAQADVFAADSKRLIYRESHWILPDDGGRWVLYRCPDGRPFARKQVASGGPVPDFALDDARGGYAEGVRGAGQARTVYVRQAGKESTRRVPVPADGVVDAGFDAAVRARWNALLRGDTVRLQFLIPSRKRFYPVRLQRTGQVNWNGMRAERLRMQLDTWFGFAVPDVILLYGHDDRRLLQFAGTGNVRDAEGEFPQVRIAFTNAMETATPSQLDAMRRMPLDGRCRF